jgi:hypothetical protein
MASLFPRSKIIRAVALFELTCSPRSRDNPLGHPAHGGTHDIRNGLFALLCRRRFALDCGRRASMERPMIDFDPTLVVVFIAAACGMAIALFALIYPSED